jgi:hypothetical protein
VDEVDWKIYFFSFREMMPENWHGGKVLAHGHCFELKSAAR